MMSETIMRRLTNVVLLKYCLCVAVAFLGSTFYFLSTHECPTSVIYKRLKLPSAYREELKLIRDEDNLINSTKLQKSGIPNDYFQRDFIEDNGLVDQLSPLLETNIDVINEQRRIQIKMFMRLIKNFKYAMLFNFAAFENKGDPAITVGELLLIRKFGLELVFSCPALSCEEEAVDFAKTVSRRYRTEELVIFMHGGGNLLSYIYEDFNRKLVLEKFPDHKVILFPQSIWHNASKTETNFFRDVYSKHRNLTFLYRDRNSYNLGRKLFPLVDCYLMPDMAFQIGAVERFMEPTHDILWLQRSDTESTKYAIPASAQDYDVIVADWWDWKTPNGSSRLEDPILIAANGMMFLQRGSVVITDRLHGHILSVLCGIPHVVLDPTNKKISSYMQSWTGGIDNVLVAHSAEDALNKAIGLLGKQGNIIPQTLSFPNSTKYRRKG